MENLWNDGWKSSKYMIEHSEEIITQNELPCDNCDHLNCGYCDLMLKWKQLHPSNNIEKYTW
jgi:hypothetical protein